MCLKLCVDFQSDEFSYITNLGGAINFKSLKFGGGFAEENSGTEFAENADIGFGIVEKW